MGNKISQGSATGRVAVITGGASGIGKAVAEHCASLKMKVCVTDLPKQENMFRENEQRLRHLGAQDLMWFPCDVSKVEQVQALHDAVYAKWDDCGFLHSNAGVEAGIRGFDSSFKQELRHVRMTMDVCFYGVLFGHQIFVPTMLKQGKDAVVVNTSSIAGLFNSAYDKQGMTDVAYTVAKNGVTLISESLDAAMRARGAPISVHILCPNGTASDGVVKNFAKGFTEEQAKKFTRMMLQPAQLPPILQDCIEKGRFYCVTPDAVGDINLARSWMLQRAEDFINDRPPLSQWRKDGQESFKKIQQEVEKRAHGPIHKLPSAKL